MTEQATLVSPSIRGSLRLDHLSLRVSDLAQSINFYTSLVGLTVISTVAFDYAHLSFGGPEKMLSLIEKESTSQAARFGSTGGGAHFALRAESLPTFYDIFQRIKEKKVACQLVDHGTTWALYLEDPDGHRIEIFVWRDLEGEGRAAWRGTTRSLPEEFLEAEYNKVYNKTLKP